jgi:hypothetical protein
MIIAKIRTVNNAIHQRVLSNADILFGLKSGSCGDGGGNDDAACCGW